MMHPFFETISRLPVINGASSKEFMDHKTSLGSFPFTVGTTNAVLTAEGGLIRVGSYMIYANITSADDIFLAVFNIEKL